MEKYPTYKDSGIKWIGEIPDHWIVLKINKLFNVKAGGDAKPDFYSYDKDEAHPFPVYTNTIDEKVYAYTSQAIFKSNSITVTGRGAIGHAIYRDTPFDAIIRLLVLTPKKQTYNCKFFTFFIDVVIPFFSDSAAIGQLSAVQLSNFHTVAPPLHEQQSIVTFLEKETANIDAYIKQREQEINTLNELKQAEIAEVVTKGINPDAPMKDSGIPWVGGIPEHWECLKIRYLFKEKSQKGFPNEPILSATQKYGVIPQDLYENRVVVVNKGLEGLKLVEVGDFVISLRSFQGGIEYAYYRGIISAAYTILRPSNTVNSNFIKFLFKSLPFIELLKTCVTGIREGQNINYDILRNNYIMLPPIEEQQQIVDYIESKTSKIEEYITTLKSEIAQMQEYKQRLISDVVTGKMDVRNFGR